MTDKNVGNESYLSIFPELLSFDELKANIQRKYPNLRALHRLTHDEAVRIFRNMLMPLPQREYRNNSRGRILRDRREKAGLQTKPVSQLSTTIGKSQNIRRTSSSDRLKPPPCETITSKVRLSNSNSQKSSSSQLEKIVINSRVKTADGTNSEEIQSRKRNETSSKQTEETSPSKAKRVKITWP